MKVELIASQSFEYNHADLKAGQGFKATDLHATLLVNGGRAKYKTRAEKPLEPEPLKEDAEQTETEDREPAAAPETDSTEQPRRGGRRYRRRDMQADES